MNGKRCLILSAGEYYGAVTQADIYDFVIAADGGYDYAAKNGISVDLLVGDFDSITDNSFCGETIRLPKEKDDTDTLFAVKEGIRRGCGEFHIYGGMGGRFDHTAANIQCLAYLAHHGKRGFLYGNGVICTALTDGKTVLPVKAGTTASVFALSTAAHGVTYSGMKYTLSDATLTFDFPLGASNEAAEDNPCISVENGTLLIIYQNNG